MSVKDLDFEGRVALLTGAASGIGHATATALAARGAQVILVDRDMEWGAAAANELNGRREGCAQYYAADLSDGAAVEECVARSGREFGRIDLLAHCAGIQTYGSAVGTSDEVWTRTLANNLESGFYLARAILPGMKERGYGSIVFVASTQSYVANRNSAAYVTSKHAIVGLMRSIALDFAPAGIRANCILPGAIDTPMIRWSASLDPNPQRVLEACASLALLKRMGTPAEVANAIVFLLSDLASFITGASLVVDGGQMVPCGGAAFQLAGTGADAEDA